MFTWFNSQKYYRDYFLRRLRLEIFKKFIIFAGVQIWLRLPCNMKFDSNLKDFKRSCCTLIVVSHATPSSVLTL